MSTFPDGIQYLKSLERLRVIGPCTGLPKWIPKLENLTHLELRIGEPGFKEWMSILSQVKSLENLELSFYDKAIFQDSTIVYIIPDSFANLSNLKRFNLPLSFSNNPYKDPLEVSLTIPGSFSRLSSLEEFETTIRLSNFNSLINLCKIKTLKKINLGGYYIESKTEGLSIEKIKQYVKENRSDIELRIVNW